MMTMRLSIAFNRDLRSDRPSKGRSLFFPPDLSFRTPFQAPSSMALFWGCDGRAKLTPGEFRSSQVWIGGTRPGNAVFVPAPVNELDECLKLFERFLHDVPEPSSPLVKAALAHCGPRPRPRIGSGDSPRPAAAARMASKACLGP